MQIMTKDGWKTVGDSQTIRPEPMTFSQARKHVLEHIYCGWLPSPRGPMGAEYAEQFNRGVEEKAKEIMQCV